MPKFIESIEVISQPTWRLKLAEHWAGERMLVACLYLGDYTERTNYEEHMLCAIEPQQLAAMCKGYVPWDSGEKVIEEHKKRPITPDEQREYDRMAKSLEPYWGNILTVGGKEYPIYNSNQDFMPCGNAPEQILTEDEAEAWKNEFRTGLWTAFDDELFLK